MIRAMFSNACPVAIAQVGRLAVLARSFAARTAPRRPSIPGAAADHGPATAAPACSERARLLEHLDWLVGRERILP
jgi:hypothetical protein